METEGSLTHSQVPATCPYPESSQSSPYPTSQCLNNMWRKNVYVLKCDISFIGA